MTKILTSHAGLRGQVVAVVARDGILSIEIYRMRNVPDIADESRRERREVTQADFARYHAAILACKLVGRWATNKYDAKRDFRKHVLRLGR